ncbi:putative ABC transport system permease protein [Edaphobacter aggregans]|uniref:Putative ABC transport system permease protein n=1 Tax=Edaphobacter aggregans TaxID=570835 RepID=A0A428MJY9_9BACT|nr:ABC transporter permease [Edaphobacter aggregans]RSL17180.1 putative ABC transport system permease protein [Edaphobacter aggregans]
MATTQLPKLSSFDRTLQSARSTMMFSEVVRLAVDSFKASKVRFLLTMLGMIIGSASIILVTTLGLTGKEYALNLISSIGPNMIEMQYDGGTVVGPDNTTAPDYMTRDDMNTVIEQVPGIIAASPMLEFHDRVSMGGGVVKDTMLLGVSPQYKQVRNLAIVAGRFFDDQDAVAHTKVAVIVAPFAIALFGTPSAAVGHSITVSGIPFVVIGVFKESVETFGQSEISDQTILIPYQVARYFTGTDTVKQIFFTMKDPTLVPAASEEILNIIKSRHRATSVYTAFNLTQVLSVMAQIANMLTIVLTLAAAITLIVSGVGIMNSMLANVQSRIKEIGIRKALGATSREIRLQFLTEAVFLSLSGGIIGTLVGLAIPWTVSLLTPFKIPTSIWSAVISLSTSVLVGVLFGTLPANRAARLDPVQTLKYE